MEVPAELAVFDTLPDVVVAIDAALDIQYVNPFAQRLLGHGADDVVGKSIVEFLHPEDLERAAEVAGLIIDDSLATEVTPALYRLRVSDGTWCSIEINATPQFTDGALADLMVIVGRYSGDNVLQDRILEMLTAGSPTDDIVALLPQFGTWRHPEAHYAVVYHDDDGVWTGAGSPAALELMERFDGADTPWRQTLTDGQGVVHSWDDLPSDLQEAAADLGMRGCFIMPVHEEEHGHMALAIAWSAKPDQHVGAHRYAVERMARALDIIMQWRSHLTGLERAAQIDALSGVANRASFFRMFQLALEKSVASGQPVAVLYVDLDRFKQVNDSQGHALGDAVITAAAERMSTVVRQSDLVARIGGDEFAILCTGVTDVAEVTALADRIVASLAEPFGHLGVEVVIGASVGIAVAEPGEVDHEALLAAADRALYEAKAAGKGRWLLAP